MTSILTGDYSKTRALAHVISLDTVSSTNDYAAQLVSNGQFSRDGVTVVFAQTQTAGRGRLDHTWMSAPGKSFIGSFISALNADLAKNPKLNGWLQMIAGLSVIDALRHTVAHTNLEWRNEAGGMRNDVLLKWPNDIVYHGMKLGGILAQLVQLPNDSSTMAVIFGVGLNLDVSPAELPTPESTSLQLVTQCTPGTAFPPVRMLADYIAASTVQGLEKRLWEFGMHPDTYAQDLHKRVLEECWTLGKAIVVHYADGTTQLGVARTINSDASLTMTDDSNKPHIVQTADVGVLPVEL